MVSLFSLSLEISFDYCLLTQTRHTLAFLREILAAAAGGFIPFGGSQGLFFRVQPSRLMVRHIEAWLTHSPWLCSHI